MKFRLPLEGPAPAAQENTGCSADLLVGVAADNLVHSLAAGAAAHLGVNSLTAVLNN